MDSNIEIRDPGICNHIKGTWLFLLVGINLVFVVLEGSANWSRTVHANLVLPIFLHFSCSFFNGIYSNIVKGDMTLLCLVSIASFVHVKFILPNMESAPCYPEIFKLEYILSLLLWNSHLFNPCRAFLSRNFDVRENSLLIRNRSRSPDTWNPPSTPQPEMKLHVAVSKPVGVRW